MTTDDEGSRRILNARIRRIDLACKLLGPFVIASIDDFSTIVAIWTTLILTLLSVAPEYICIAQTYYAVPALGYRSAGQLQSEPDESEETPLLHNGLPTPNATKSEHPVFSWVRFLLSSIFPISSIRFYSQHRAFLPSLAYVFLHLTVLSFSGRMIVFLLSIGYSSLAVGIARTICTFVELSATWTTPKLIERAGNVMAGFYSISLQALCLTFGVACFIVDWNGALQTHDGAMLGAGGLILGVIFSRIGLWGVDLTTQIIVQDEVEEEYRGAFSTAEASSQNLFEMMSYVSTIVYYRPEQFQWPMYLTLASVYAGWLTYAIYVYRGPGRCLEMG
ncbi:hypothetical protein jhhlp_000721 [Lomentospora prolificans]|uniref:Solute carrier family 40 member n=1 Tax=Lomentospora prolificans TaxID=41688 RepID=A0A2N3NJC2_9PEZI|nr:hypothetical protein jhhlp_000721 [Lomentospora prolificans]